jgi:anti-sigma regulatory factor (Ser/Thr protein kinase)
MSTRGDSAQGPDLELEFPPKPEYVRMARLAVAALARLRDADDDLVEDIKLAVSEACTRAVATNGVDAPQEPVQVQATVYDRALRVDVLDRGPGPDREVSGDPQELDTEELPFESALAVPLIRGLVDEVGLAPRPGGGTKVRMVVSLGAVTERP